ncbi:MAG: UbiA family prenyltransferase [Candidatus Limnocylindrales bacterium]
MGLIRLVHPFPSLLDGLVVAGVAVVATGDLSTALRLGASMTALQASIGAVNDLRDAPADAGHKPGKPLPAGIVGRHSAAALAASASGLGLLLAGPSGVVLIALAVVVLGIGYTYDLVAKGTAWSWVPFAVGIPILPLYGWLGAAGSVPTWFAALLPMALLAGGSLAIANARADMARDAAAGIGSVALALGSGRSWWAGALSMGAALVLAVTWLLTTGRGTPVAAGIVSLGAILAAAGLALAWTPSEGRRERAWQLQAIGTATVAIGWILAAAISPGVGR